MTILQTYDRLVKANKRSGADRFLYDLMKGGVLFPDDIHEKTGDLMCDSLNAKHPDVHIPFAESLEEYENVPTEGNIDITMETMGKVGRTISVSAGLGRTNAVNLKYWLSSFGDTSIKLKEQLAILGGNIAKRPSWARI